jgi:hypothetical protein
MDQVVLSGGSCITIYSAKKAIMMRHGKRGGRREMERKRGRREINCYFISYEYFLL